ILPDRGPGRLDEVDALEGADRAVPDLRGRAVDVGVTPVGAAVLLPEVDGDVGVDVPLVLAAVALDVGSPQLGHGPPDVGGREEAVRGDLVAGGGRAAVADVGAAPQLDRADLVDRDAGVEADDVRGVR